MILFDKEIGVLFCKTIIYKTISKINITSNQLEQFDKLNHQNNHGVEDKYRIIGNDIFSSIDNLFYVYHKKHTILFKLSKVEKKNKSYDLNGTIIKKYVVP